MVTLPPLVAEPVLSPEIVSTTVEFASMLAEVCIKIVEDATNSAFPDNPIMGRVAFPTKKRAGSDTKILSPLDNAPPTDVRNATVARTPAI